MFRAKPVHSKRSLFAHSLSLVLTLTIASTYAEDVFKDVAKDAASKRNLQAKINLLVKAGKSDEAAAAMHTLYPNGPPPGGEMALDYYDVVGNTDKGWDEAKTGLERLVKAAPYDVGYRMALAKQLARRGVTRLAGLQMFAELAKQSDLRERALGEWRLGISLSTNVANRVAMYQDYLKVDPANTAILNALAVTKGEQDKQQAGKQRDVAAREIEAGHLEEAVVTLKKALILDPKNTWVRFDLARLYLKQGGKKQGQLLMEQGMSNSPGDADSIYASALYTSLADETENALRLLDKIPPSKRSASVRQFKQKLIAQLHDKKTGGANLQASQSSKIRDTADQQQLAGHPQEAISTLQKALQQDPKDPWVRFDLARLHHKQGDIKQGRALMEEGISIAPNDIDILYANALYLSLLDETENALHLLEKIPPARRSASMQRLNLKLTIKSKILQAQAAARYSDSAAMQAKMEQATSDAGNDAELVNIVADAWTEMNESDRGIALMRHLDEQPSSTMDIHLYYAKLLAKAERNVELAAELDKLSGEKRLTDEDKSELRYLKSALAVHRADKLRHAGQFTEGKAVLKPALQADPENVDLLHALVRLHIAAHEPQQAAEVYKRILSISPNDVDTRLALLKSTFDEGKESEALDGMKELLANTPRENINARMAIADMYIQMDEIATAHRVVEETKKYSPENTRVIIQEGRLARAEGHSKEAMDYYKQAHATDEIVAMERGRAGGYIEAGIENLSKTDGTPGISNFVVTEIPVEMRVPVGYDGGQAFVQVDHVSASAGTLTSDSYSLNRFGKIMAQPPTASQLSAAADQSASGTALMVGYEGGGFRADIGTTPPEFPVSEVVGGLKWSHYTETSGLSVDVARRPLTSSLLAYAGVRDPSTGAVWGGVSSTGASMHVSRNNERLNGFIDLGYYLLTGTNVLDNTKLSLRTGFDWSFIQAEDMSLTVGLTLTDWMFKEDLSNFSFGHGGYYSPQQYTSISLPVRWKGRVNHWSYLLQGSMSASESYSKDMALYPTNAALQAQAIANSSVSSATYTGGSSPGTGYSLRAALEYQFTSRLFVGGDFQAERADYYAPNTGIVYLRYMFDDYTAPVPYPPSPVKPYSQY